MENHMVSEYRDQGTSEDSLMQDPVTMLRNQNGFLEDLETLLEKGKEAVLLMTGFSRLSLINKQYGYPYGNRILQEVAFLIQETVKERGQVYRLNNAKFAVLSDSISREELGAIYDTLRIKLQRGILVDGIRNILLGNGGLFSVMGRSGSAPGIFSCLHYAYEESKLRMHGELVDYNGTINYGEAGSIELVGEVRDAILDGCRGFHLMYQPLVNPMTGRIPAIEAQIAWEDEKFGKVSFQRFVPILERDFVFEELGDWILEHAMKDGLLLVEKDPEVKLVINISPVQMEDDYFSEDVKQLIENTRFPTANLFFKLTRDCRLVQTDRVREVVEQLHEQGVRFIMDDFGTGFESIGFLKKVSADGVYFDSTLLDGIEENDSDRQMLDYLVKLVRARTDFAVIKGVDNEALKEAVEGMPVTSLQGSYYGDPMLLSEVLKRL